MANRLRRMRRRRRGRLGYSPGGVEGMVEDGVGGVEGVVSGKAPLLSEGGFPVSFP